MPFIKWETVVALATFAIAQELLQIRPLKQKFDIIADGFTTVYEENAILKDKALYLLSVLEKNEIELDDFDMIALTHDIPE